MTGFHTFTTHRWCDRCRRTIAVTVEMEISSPPEGYWRRRWEDSALRVAEVAFQTEHLAKHDPAAPPVQGCAASTPGDS